MKFLFFIVLVASSLVFSKSEVNKWYDFELNEEVSIECVYPFHGGECWEEYVSIKPLTKNENVVVKIFNEAFSHETILIKDFGAQDAYRVCLNPEVEGNLDKCPARERLILNKGFN